MPARRFRPVRGSQSCPRRRPHFAALRAASLALLALGSTALIGCESNPLDLRPGATSIFEAFRLPSPSEAAAWAVNEDDDNLRYRGTLLLANAPFAGESIYLELFTRNATDTDPGVRAAATRGLGNHGGPAQASLIIPRLADDEVAVRVEAARALQRIHNPEAIDPLLKAATAASEPDPEVRYNAALALGQYRDRRVLERLIANLDDESLAVNRGTLASLSTLTGHNLGVSRRAWLDWFNATQDHFVAGRPYEYPAYSRDMRWYERLPFVPKPPNETPGPPAGIVSGPVN